MAFSWGGGAFVCILTVASCDSPEVSVEPHSETAALSNATDACAQKARTALDHARRSGRGADKARDEEESAWADCAISSPACSCDLEQECREVARRNVARACDDQHRQGRHDSPRVDHFVREELEHCRSLCSSPSIDLQRCADRVRARTDLVGKEREVAYQEDIGRYCGAPGLGRCQNQRIARANVDYTSAAMQVLGGQMTAAQYLALSRDRTRKLRSLDEDGRRAAQLCRGPDTDGDWVPDSLDRCPDTPDLAATDDSGCPDPTLPSGPDTAAVRRVLAGMNLAINPNCRGALVPGRVPAGGFYWPSDRSKGTFILAGAVEDQPPGCSVWYQFEIEELGGREAGFVYDVAFLDREANPDLVGLGRPVPSGFVQFNPRPTDPRPDRVRLAETGFKAKVRYRVRAINATGARGPWSDWKMSDRSSCTALGFQCAGP